MNQTRCELCGRMTRRDTTRHHLIPRTVHHNKWFRKRFTREEMHATVDLCRECHHAVHDLIPDEKELGRSYHTLEKLLAHGAIAGHIEWVRKRR